MEQRSAVAREAASKQLEDGLKARKEMLHLINETARRVNETKIAEMELGRFSKWFIIGQSNWYILLSAIWIAILWKPNKDDAENSRRVADIQNLKTELKENR